MKIVQLLLLTLIFSSASSQVITWSGPSEYMSDKYYRVKVNGIPIPVYDTPIASYAVFDFTGKVKVEVTTMFDVRWVDARPIRLNITPEYITDNKFSFSMEQPENISLELNGRIRQQPLFIFSNTPEQDIPNKEDNNVIWFESGKLYKDVKLRLADNQIVYIEGGAVVQGYMFAENNKNIKIRGRGIIDGSLNVHDKNNDNRFLSFMDCADISIEDVILHNGTTWQIAAYHSDKVHIKNTRIVSESGGDDGIDLVRCTNSIVEGVFAHTKDDCIAIKSGGNYPAAHPTDNILVRNCTFWNSIWGNAIEIGFELNSEEVKNIRFENIDIIHVEDGAAISIHNAGPAHVHNILFDNIRIEDSRQKLLDVAIFYSQWGPDGNKDPEFIRENYLHGAWDGVQKIPPEKEPKHKLFRGTISNVKFKNIHVLGGVLPFSVFHGYSADKNVSNIIIENLYYQGIKLTNEKAAKIRKYQTQNLTIK
jgi:hypothetical protein